MTFIEEELEALERNPEYKRFLKVYIKYQIHTLVQKLSDVGEESFLVTASVTDGTFSHVGSSVGQVFLDKASDLTWKFLSFCSSTDHHPRSFSPTQRNGSSNESTVPLYTEPEEGEGISMVASRRNEVTHRPKYKRAKQTILSDRASTVAESNHETDATMEATADVDEIWNGGNPAVRIKSEPRSEVLEHSNQINDNGNRMGQTDCVDDGNTSSEHIYYNDDGSSAPPDSQMWQEGNDMSDYKTFKASIKNRHSMETLQTIEPYRENNNDRQTESTFERWVDHSLDTSEQTHDEEQEYYDDTDSDHTGTKTEKIIKHSFDSQNNPIKSSKRPLSYVDVNNDFGNTSGLTEEDVVCLVDDDDEAEEGQCHRNTSNEYEDVLHSFDCHGDNQFVHTRWSGLRHVCNICDKTFKTRKGLKLHEMTHRGERPYKCTMCSKGFVIASHLKVHLRTHTGERPYICKVCGKGFIVSSKLNRHAVSHFEKGVI